MVPWVAKIRAQQQMLHVCGVVVVAPRRAVDGLTAVQMCHAALTDGLLSYYHCWFESNVVVKVVVVVVNSSLKKRDTYATTAKRYLRYQKPQMWFSDGIEAKCLPDVRIYQALLPLSSIPL